jgi:hypothetical protein
VGRAGHRRLPFDVPALRRRLQHHRFSGGRDDPPRDPEEPGRFVQSHLHVPGAGHEPGDDQVPERMTGEFIGVGVEALLEDLG